MLENIDSLREIHRSCTEGQPLSPALQTWLAGSLELFLAHDCNNLNEAFGLVQGHGGVPWWRERAMRQRDAALQALSLEYFGNLTIYSRAKAVAETVRRYQDTCWGRDRLSDHMPERYSGTPKEHLWHAFKSEAKMPVSERRLRTLLAN